MNIAFATILILFILSPGFVFNVSFYSGVFSRKHIKTTFVDQVPLSIIPGLFINLLWYLGVELVSNYKISLKTVGLLIIGPKSDECTTQCFQNVEVHLAEITIYFVTIWLFSFFLGHVLRAMIRKRKYDRKYKPFRIANYWHYFISGEYLDFPEPKTGRITEKGEEIFGHNDLDVVMTYVKTSSDLDNHELLYYGHVVHFELDSEGDLKSIFLKNSTKKDVFYDLSPDHQISVLEERVVGILMVPFKSILDINMRYYQVEVETENETDNDNPGVERDTDTEE